MIGRQSSMTGGPTSVVYADADSFFVSFEITHSPASNGLTSKSYFMYQNHWSNIFLRLTHGDVTIAIKLHLWQMDRMYLLLLVTVSEQELLHVCSVWQVTVPGPIPCGGFLVTFFPSFYSRILFSSAHATCGTLAETFSSETAFLVASLFSRNRSLTFASVSLRISRPRRPPSRFEFPREGADEITPQIFACQPRCMRTLWR
jgi:hypothetical protein